VIVDDANVVGVTIAPRKDDAPLLVDADGMEACQVTGKGLEAIAGRHSEVLQGNSSVQSVELSQGNGSDIGRDGAKARRAIAVEESLCGRISEGDDHPSGTISLSRNPCNHGSRRGLSRRKRPARKSSGRKHREVAALGARRHSAKKSRIDWRILPRSVCIF
jgi:hypothetical protein